MWDCVGWRAVVAHTRGPETPDVSQDLRHLYGPLQWGCQEDQAGSPVGVSLCPLQCWSISAPTSSLATSPAVLLPYQFPGKSYWSVLPVGAGQDGQWICTSCLFIPGHLSSALHRKVTGHRGFSFHVALSSWPLFSEKKKKNPLLVWLSVKQQLSVEKPPLYPRTSWEGGKVPSISTLSPSV